MTAREETGRGTWNLEAYLKTMEARGHILRYTREDNAKARKLFEEVVVLDPNLPNPIWVSQCSHAAEVWLGTSKSPQESLKQAIEMANKALALDRIGRYRLLLVSLPYGDDQAV